MKKILYTALIILNSSYFYGQDFGLVAPYPQVTRPEPSVSSLMKFEEIPVSNYTGVPDVSVPVYNLPTRSKDISLNLTLGYHPSSVAMDEVPGECGLGWSLFSGGMISRTVINKPDEFSGGYAETNKNDIYQFNFMGHTGRFYLNKDTSGILNLRILENANSKLVITVNYNVSTYDINSFTAYDDKGYRYLFQDNDVQTYYNPVTSNPAYTYKSAFHLTQVFDNNNKELINFNYDSYTQVVNVNYSNVYKKCNHVISAGFGKINFIYSSGSNHTYSENTRLSELDLLNLSDIVLKKNKFIYTNDGKNLTKIENCEPTETIKEVYEFKYKAYDNVLGGHFEPDVWGYRKFVPENLYSYPIENVDHNVSIDYCSMGVLEEVVLPTGASVKYVYESNSSSPYVRDANGNWQLVTYPIDYFDDSMPENFTVSTFDYHEFLGNGTNTYSFTVPGTGTSAVHYYLNFQPTPYTAATIDESVFIPLDDQRDIYYPRAYISGEGIVSSQSELHSYNNVSYLGLGQDLWLIPGKTYTLTINAYGNNNKKAIIHITKKEIRANPDVNVYGGGIRIKNISYFNNTTGVTEKQKNYTYNLFGLSGSSGAYVNPSYDEATNARIKREPVGYKNVTVSEPGNGRQEFTYTSPMDFPYNGQANGIDVVYYDYKRGLLTNRKTYTEAGALQVATDLDYDYVEIPNSTVFFDNPALNERLGWAKLKQRITKQYFSNSIATPVTITENYTYNDNIRKIVAKTATDSYTGELLKTQYTYHTGNSSYSQNRIGEIEKVEAFRGNDLLFTKKMNFSNSWSGNGSYLPNIQQASKGSQTLENVSRITVYDEFSNPMESQQENGIYITYLWGYNKTLLIAKIENASNAQVASALGLGSVYAATEASLTSIDALRTNTAMVNAMITTYTFTPLVGITSVTDPKGDKMSYEYDSFYRLKAVRDKKNKLLTESIYYQAQNSTELNSVTNIAYKTDAGALADAQQAKIFLDGLGRPIQDIAYKASSTGKDIVSIREYDSSGKETRKYLPYTNSASSLSYNANAKTELLAYTDTNYVGQYPYSETAFEHSPLNRILEQAAPGTDWQIDNTVKHTVRFDYQTNLTADAVRMFKVVADETSLVSNGYYGIPLTDAGFYPERELFKLVTKNENWKTGDGTNNTIEEYQNKEGRTILKRAYGVSVVNNVEINTTHDTYNVYDQYGNLTYVIPPKADSSITAPVLDELCYQYRYDQRNRLVEKKLPGKQWEFIVYDKLNRVVAVGPALSPFTDAPANTYGWGIAKYDALNRKILTAWQTGTTTSAGRKSLQNTYSTTPLPLNEAKSSSDTPVNNVAFRYTTAAYPTSGYSILTVTYYDDYNYTGAPTTFTTVMNDNSQDVYYNNSTFKPKGLITGNWSRFIETSGTSPVRAEVSSVMYDNKARAVRARAVNYLGGYTQVDNRIDFAGKVLFTETKHKRLNADATEIYIKEAFTYSNQDRLLTHTHQIGTAGTPQLLSQNTYSELGRLISKKIGYTAAEPLQKVDYKYNIRGWLTEINNVNSLTDTPKNDLFAYKINYNNVENENNYVGKELYNGNISETYWRTAKDDVKRKYGYEYDNLNRLKKAVYQKPDAFIKVTGSYNESTTYDKNGNIKTMQRNGDFDDPNVPFLMDNLTYNYDLNNTTNRLAKVTDATNSTIGFKDDSNGTNDTLDDYSYDANGNMTKDDNKGIANIKYNHLNLPTEIVFTGSTTKKINYLYDGSGNKLQKIVTNNTVVSTTDYLGGFQYTKPTAASATALQFFPTAEGYVNNTVSGGVNNFNYIYTYKDQSGNVRLLYTRDTSRGGTGVKILEESNYYPFGLQHTNYNWDKAYYDAVASGEVIIDFTPNVPYKYKYNGQENQDELSLNTTAMDFRQYDSALGRFTGMDLLAENSVNMTPYHFGNDNPVYFSDPSGLEAAFADMLQDLIKASSDNGWTTWTNQGGGIWSTTDQTSGGGGPGFFDTNSHTFFEMVGLPEIVVIGSSSTWDKQLRLHTYHNSPFYKTFYGVDIKIWPFDIGSASYIGGAINMSQEFYDNYLLEGEKSKKGRIIMHEYGHYLQNRYYGSLYYNTSTAPESAYSFLTGTTFEHNNSGVEVEASTMAFYFFQKPKAFPAEAPINPNIISDDLKIQLSLQYQYLNR